MKIIKKSTMNVVRVKSFNSYLIKTISYERKILKLLKT